MRDNLRRVCVLLTLETIFKLRAISSKFHISNSEMIRQLINTEYEKKVVKTKNKKF